MGLDIQPYPGRPKIHDDFFASLRCRNHPDDQPCRSHEAQIWPSPLPKNILAAHHRTDAFLSSLVRRYSRPLCALRPDSFSLPQIQGEKPAHLRAYSDPRVLPHLPFLRFNHTPMAAGGKGQHHAKLEAESREGDRGGRSLPRRMAGTDDSQDSDFLGLSDIRLPYLVWMASRRALPPR